MDAMCTLVLQRCKVRVQRRVQSTCKHKTQRKLCANDHAASNCAEAQSARTYTTATDVLHNGTPWPHNRTTAQAQAPENNPHKLLQHWYRVPKLSPALYRYTPNPAAQSTTGNGPNCRPTEPTVQRQQSCETKHKHMQANFTRRSTNEAAELSQQTPPAQMCPCTNQRPLSSHRLCKV
jgi:hypothetical protein